VPSRIVLSAAAGVLALAFAACGVGGPEAPGTATGATGGSGLAGATGASGPAGATGASGASGASGFVGVSGASGFSGAVPAGEPGLDESAFWNLIEETRSAAGDNTGRQSSLLAQRLRGLSAQQIADFGRIHNSLDRRAYSWDLWGAAYVIEDGCSDDCFRDFRSYLISLGQGAYEDALDDPDSLAGTVEDAERGDWENADDVAAEAYEDATGEDIPAGDSDLSGQPSGEEWDDDQEGDLIRRYPSLAAEFR
jgi:Protein of unknown function (DUF4240)